MFVCLLVSRISTMTLYCQKDVSFAVFDDCEDDCRDQSPRHKFCHTEGPAGVALAATCRRARRSLAGCSDAAVRFFSPVAKIFAPFRFVTRSFFWVISMLYLEGGRHAIGNTDSYGIRLLSLCSEFDLIITNTLFRQRNQHNATRQHPRSKHWYLIDYVILRRCDTKDATFTRGRGT